MEGSVFVAGAAVQWLRDSLGLIASAAETESIAASVPDTRGVYLVPAFVGLGAPYWDASARGVLSGLTRAAGKAEIVRATLESIAYQSRELIDAMEADTGEKVLELRVDGGAAVNNFLMQFQADILDKPRRPSRRRGNHRSRSRISRRNRRKILVGESMRSRASGVSNAASRAPACRNLSAKRCS